MPFFCDRIVFLLSLLILSFPEIIEKNKIKKFVTLQVRIPLCRITHRKRVFFFTSASMTVEAALVLPLFLFAGVILMMPFRILDVERQMQAIVNSVGEDISQAAYLMTGDGDTERMDSDQRSAAGIDVWGEGVISSLSAYGYAEAAVRLKAGELPVEGLSLSGSELLDDGETVNLVVKYQMKLPFSVFGLDKIDCANACYLRAWVGQSGSGGAGAEQGAEEDPIVYVGRDSTRYHVSASCHYLNNHLTAVSAGQIGNYRNSDGSRYTACARCGGQAAGTVYIMPSGEHYHSSPSCSAIQAYVSAVHKSEVEYLGPCSYCSGG